MFINLKVVAFIMVVMVFTAVYVVIDAIIKFIN